MAQMNANNPGSIVTYRDGSLVVANTTSQTGNLTLVDFALWGPVNQPVNVGSIEAAQDIFGTVTGAYGQINRQTGYNGNALLLSVDQALQANNRNLTLVRPDFGGVQASTTLFYSLMPAACTDGTIALKVVSAGSLVQGAVLSLANSPTTQKNGLLTNLNLNHACWISSNPSVIYQVTSINSGGAVPTVTLAPCATGQTLPIDVDTASTAVLGTGTSQLTLTAGANYPASATVQPCVVVAVAESSETATAIFAPTTNTLTITLGSVSMNNTASLIAAVVNAAVTCVGNVTAVGGVGTTVISTTSSHSFTNNVVGSSVWVFAAGFTLAGAFPGAVGNMLKYNTTLSGDGADNDSTINFNFQVPIEFGGTNFTYNSLYFSTLGALAVQVNSDMQNMLIMSLTYATGNESIGYFNAAQCTTLNGLTPSIINGILNNVNDTVALNAAAAPSIANISNPSNNGSYCIGSSPVNVVNSLINSTVTVGTDATTTANGQLMNPSLGIISSNLRHQWYAQALGNVLLADTGVGTPDMDVDNLTLPLLRGQSIGVIMVPSLYIDDMCDSNTGAILNLDGVATPTNPFGQVAAVSGNAAVPYSNALQFLLDFCHQQNLDGISTEMVIGVSPLRSTTLAGISARARYLATLGFMTKTLNNQDGNSVKIDAGRYLSVVAGPHVLITSRDLGTYVSCGATQYAALLTTQTLDSSPSQKQVNGTISMGYQFTRNFMSKLSGGQGNSNTGGAFVVFDGISGSPVVNLAMTAAAQKSDYAKIHNRRVVTAAGSATRAAIRPFLGNAFGVEQYNAMTTAIQSSLDALVDAKIISGGKGDGYDFSITQTLGDSVLGFAHVSLSVRPIFELDWVTVDVKLQV